MGGRISTDLRFFGNAVAAAAGVLGFFGVLGSFLTAAAAPVAASFLGSRFGVTSNFFNTTFGEAERDFFLVLGVVVTVSITSASLSESSTETGESGTISADFRLRRLLRATFGAFSASFFQIWCFQVQV